MHEIEKKLNNLFVSGFDLEINGGAYDSTPVFSQFSQDATSSLTKQLTERTQSKDFDPFKLSMSNVGKDLRQLCLEKLFGKAKREDDPSFRVKMLTGDMLEAVFITAMKLAGVDIVKEQTPVTLELLNNGYINGTLDLTILHEDGIERVWDIKTASDWAYNNKFVDYETLKSKDDFGYITQLYGYTAALWDGENPAVQPGGWLVINKNNGNYKIVEVPKDYDKDLEESISYIQYIHDFINSPELAEESIPPCQGVQDELWRGKKTGNKILGGNCIWCPYKDKCHPKGVEKRVCDNSKAKDPKYKWYIK